MGIGAAATWLTRLLFGYACLLFGPPSRMYARVCSDFLSARPTNRATTPRILHIYTYRERNADRDTNTDGDTGTDTRTHRHTRTHTLTLTHPHVHRGGGGGYYRQGYGGYGGGRAYGTGGWGGGGGTYGTGWGGYRATAPRWGGGGGGFRASTSSMGGTRSVSGAYSFTLLLFLFCRFGRAGSLECVSEVLCVRSLSISVELCGRFTIAYKAAPWRFSLWAPCFSLRMTNPTMSVLSLTMYAGFGGTRRR